ncbi:hypothetical protein BG005_005019, partial [Podila minutissima]
IIQIKPLPRSRKGNSKDKSGKQWSILDGLCPDDVNGGDAEDRGNVEDRGNDDCKEGAGQDIDTSNNNNEENSEEQWYSTATILMHLTAIGDLYKHQCEDKNNLAMDYATVLALKTYLQSLIDAYRLKMSTRKRSTDTDFGSINFTQDPTSIVRQLMRRFWMCSVE